MDQKKDINDQPREVVAGALQDYNAGLLNDFGGGNVEWWQDYLRAEIERANGWWRSQVLAALQPSVGGEPVDLHKAIGRVRARTNHPGTLEHHHPSYADGMRAACNMLERMRIVKSVFLASPAQADGWRPIDEAPRDGTWIVARYLSNRPFVARWEGQVWTDGYQAIRGPTHWLKLPEFIVAPSAPRGLGVE